MEKMSFFFLSLLSSLYLYKMTNSTRHRATLSSNSIPVPPETHTTNHINMQPQQQQQNLLSVNTLLPNGRRNSQPQLSSSAPSFGSFLNGSTTSSNSSQRSSNEAISHHSSIRREAPTASNLPQLTIEFDGGTHIIVRPNRVIRGNLTKKFFGRYVVP